MTEQEYRNWIKPFYEKKRTGLIMGVDKEYYRVSLCVPKELEQTLKDAAWKSRKSMTEYINEAIQEKLEKDNLI